MSADRRRHRARPATELDRRFMAAAIELGRRNLGQTGTEPSVGAIVVLKTEDGFEVVARAVTNPGGRPHAETQVLAAAGERARGSTVYLTLEPCSHFGPEPPCAQALASAGVAHVVTAIADPDPRFAGRGHAMLERLGVTVTTGVLAVEAERLHAGPICRVRRGRPHVDLALSISADGCIGRANPGPSHIADPSALRHLDGLRLHSDAVLVGVRRIIETDPSLTCALPGCENRSPIRVIADADALTPPGARVVGLASRSPTWIFVAPDAPDERVRALLRQGVLVLVAERDASGQLDVGDVLFQLSRLGVATVLAEGGTAMARTLIDADVIDEAHFMLSPRLIGSGGAPVFGGRPVSVLTENPNYDTVDSRRLGADRLVHLFRRSRDPRDSKA